MSPRSPHDAANSPAGMPIFVRLMPTPWGCTRLFGFRPSCSQPDQTKVAIPRPQLHPWGCVRCGEEEHTAAVRYVLHSPDDFDFGVRRKRPTARREDAFVWFGMDATCCRCRLFTWLWFEYETM
jgi:hypothetical protein